MPVAFRQTGGSRLKRVVLGIALCTVGIVAAFCWGTRFLSEPQQAVLKAVSGGTDITIQNLKHTALREGQREWHLEAQSASVDSAKARATLQGLKSTFFLADGTTIFLTAREGVLHYETNDIEVSGDVVLTKGAYRLATETLHYDHQRRVMFSRTPVVLTARRAQVAADGMQYDLDTNHTILQGHVDGTFFANFIW